MTTSVFIATHNPYPDYTTKYAVYRDVNTQISPDFTNYNDAAAWASSNGYCVISGSMGWNIGGNPPCPVITPAPITPPHGDRYCIDSGMIGVWNVITQSYDNQRCQAPNTSCQNGFCVAPPAPTPAPAPTPTTTKPPASGEPETFYETYRGYTINTQGSYLHVLRPNGTGIGLFNSVISARQGIDADIDSQTPKLTSPPYGQRYCIDPETIAVWNQVSGKYDSARCLTGACKDGYCATPSPMPTPTTPPSPPPVVEKPPIAPYPKPVYGDRYCVDESTIGVWNTEKLVYDVAKCQNPPCKSGYCATPPTPTETPKGTDWVMLGVVTSTLLGLAYVIVSGRK